MGNDGEFSRVYRSPPRVVGNVVTVGGGRGEGNYARRILIKKKPNERAEAEFRRVASARPANGAINDDDDNIVT